MAEGKKVFTVFGYYEDNGQVWSTFAHGPTAYEAAREAVREMAGNSNTKIEDIAVVEVFEGEVRGTCFTESVAYGVDLLADHERAELFDNT